LRGRACRALAEDGGTVAIERAPVLADARRSRRARVRQRLALGIPPDPQDFVDEPRGLFDVELGDLPLEHGRPVFAVGPGPVQSGSHAGAGRGQGEREPAIGESLCGRAGGVGVERGGDVAVECLPVLRRPVVEVFAALRPRLVAEVLPHDVDVL